MSLPEPSFIERDVNKITAEMVAAYEAATGKTLYPAQPEMLLISQFAYRESLLRIAIQEAAKQNLVEYAIFPMLDYLADLVGVVRLSAMPATTTLRFFLASVQGASVFIPAATRVESAHGQMVFTTDLELTIAAGATYGDVAATAETAGVGGNGYGIGTIKNPVVAVAYVNSIANQTTSSGGAEEESNEQLRLRIKEAPEQWSNAGSKGAYKFFTKSAHASIIDVEVLSPVPGSVYIYPLTTNGTPEQVVLDAVAALCSAETVRPLCDAVTVEAPTRKTFSIVANLTLFASADQALTLAAVQAALGAYAVKMRQALGRDLVLEEISALIMSVDGVYKPGLTQPAADIVNATNEWSDCTAMTVNVVGTAVG